MNEGADIETMIFFGAIGWIIGGMGLIVFQRRNWLFLGNELKFVIIAGLLVYAIIWLLTNALMIGDATLIIPVTNMGFVAAFVYSVLLRMESMNLKKVLPSLLRVWRFISSQQPDEWLKSGISDH